MRKKYVAPSMREFNVPCEATIMAGSGIYPGFTPSVTPRVDDGEEDLDGDTYDASGGDTSTPQP
ncbi:hypothetical protein [Prevotella histicola]|uniref:hypothetical protein n=1 Tax=Prevotella histicola TaxID=470565 RepID=UPI00055DC5C9|nr:hypothetical protein [Prevotella histicola]MBW4776226.1 hypothetical protein [Prevotella histicola]